MSSQGRPDSLRRKVVFVAITLSFLAILVRAFMLQWESHRKLKKLSYLQSVRKVVVVGPRGPILDAKGKILATTLKTYYLVAFPRRVEDKRLAAKEIAKILGGGWRNYYKKLLTKRGFIRLVKVERKKDVEALKKLRLKGILLAKEYTRSYPRDPLFRWTLGNVGMDMQGICGVEFEYDHILRGKVKRRERVIRDARGYLLLFSPGGESKIEGVKLSLDSRVGTICQEELEKTVKAFKAKGGMVIVMIPSTGRIISLISYPYAPGKGYFRNPIYSRLIEPGSVMKPLVLAEALEEKVVSLKTPINCGRGRLRILGHTIHDVHPYRILTAEDVVVKSSNVGISRIALLLGKGGMERLFKKLGFGEDTGIDVEGDERGLVGSFDTKLDVACKAFGQGISITFLHLAKAFCSLANGGFLPKPFLGESVVDEKGRMLDELESPFLKRVFSEDVADSLKKVLREVVKRGTGVKADIPGYGVCGKTGTAQKLEKKGVYSRRKFYSIFVGFLPYEDPKLLVAVLIDEPKGSYYGGDVAAPLFKRIAKRLIAYYSIPPETPEDLSEAIKPKVERRKVKKREGGFPDLRGLTLREALRKLKGIKVVIHGTKGKIVSQRPRPGKRGRFKRCDIYLED